MSVGRGLNTSPCSWNVFICDNCDFVGDDVHGVPFCGIIHRLSDLCAGATKTATEVCKYTQMEFLDLFSCFCYTINE